MKTFGEQKNCALDRIKPYQRPKLSDPACGRRGLQSERDGQVRWSAWLAGVLVTLILLPAVSINKPKRTSEISNVLGSVQWGYANKQIKVCCNVLFVAIYSADSNQWNLVC